MTSMVLRRVSKVISTEEGDVQEHLVLVFECSKDTEQPQRPENRETEEDGLRGFSFVGLSKRGKSGEGTYGVLVEGYFYVVRQHGEQVDDREECCGGG
jgi:hypothetical protein